MDRRVASDNCLEISNETERAGGRGEAVQARRVSVLLFPCWSNDLHDTVDDPRTFTFAKEYFFRGDYAMRQK